MTLYRYFHKPKGLLILLLAGLGILAARGPDWRPAAVSVAVAALVAIAIDAPILRWRKGHWDFPDGALLTGMIVAMVLARQVPLRVVAITSAVAVLSKHMFRTSHANVFNPAALALLATYFIFFPAQDWWGSMPESGWISLVLLAAAGIFIVERIHKLPLLVAFLAAYYLLFTGAAFLGNPETVAGVYRGADLHAVLFFVFFMLSDPPTSPPRARDQVIFAAIAAVGCFAVRELAHAVYFFLAGLLIANIWEAARRVRVERHRKLVLKAAV